MKGTGKIGPWIHCKYILAQIKIIQLEHFWWDQNCRFFVSKIDCFFESFFEPKKNDQFYFEKNCNFDPIEKVLIEWFSFGPIYIYNKRTHEFKVQFGWFTSKPLVPIRIMCEVLICTIHTYCICTNFSYLSCIIQYKMKRTLPQGLSENV